LQMIQKYNNNLFLAFSIIQSSTKTKPSLRIIVLDWKRMIVNHHSRRHTDIRVSSG
jgi:hypothetical protein